MLKKLTKSKTMIFASILAALGALQASMDVFTAWLDAQAMGLLTMLVGMIVAVLRVLTTTSLSDK